MVWSQSTMEEIFTPEEMIILHRVHLEMQRAKTCPFPTGTVSPLEVVTGDGTEDTIMDCIIERDETVEGFGHYHLFFNEEGVITQVETQTPDDLVSLSQLPPQPTHLFGDASLPLTPTQNSSTFGQDFCGIDEAIAFWQRLINDGYQPDQEFEMALAAVQSAEYTLPMVPNESGADGNSSTTNSSSDMSTMFDAQGKSICSIGGHSSAVSCLTAAPPVVPLISDPSKKVAMADSSNKGTNTGPSGSSGVSSADKGKTKESGPFLGLLSIVEA